MCVCVWGGGVGVCVCVLIYFNHAIGFKTYFCIADLICALIDMAFQLQRHTQRHETTVKFITSLIPD